MQSTLLPVPHHRQRSDGECLAACAAMVVDYLGITCDYGYLLGLLGVKPYGTPGSHLDRLAELGVLVRYAHGTLDELFAYLADGHPCIVLLRTA
ncbi:MAG: hypothetical protein JW850_09855 [Thermoflexales bacterium]|nr:hypothetical protein [Thermoflexales bacterium]